MEEDREIADLASDMKTDMQIEDKKESTDSVATTSTPLKTEEETAQKQPKKRFIGRRAADAKAAAERAGKEDTVEETQVQLSARKRTTARALNNVPDTILHDKAINEAIALLPRNYNFELHKTIHRIRLAGAKKVALQMPEGLLLFATTISDIITQFCPGTSTLIMGDVTYGACCVDDYTARALQCDMLVHYAHSCLIPVNITKIATLYVFVDIAIDVEHLLATIDRNFKKGSTIAVVGTIQFNATVHGVAPQLRSAGYNIFIPQIAPLSKGEILGCTSPHLTNQEQAVDLILYLGDGRFHLESAMIHNPTIPAYRYDPYSRRLTHETYDHKTLLSDRSTALAQARKAKRWGLILGSLGRQGNPHTMTLIEQHLQDAGIPWINISLSEIFPGKLALMSDVECWVQVACPRLSIDWGYAFPRPLLTPYEALVVLDGRESWEKTGSYPMDYYGKNGLGRVTVESLRSAEQQRNGVLDSVKQPVATAG